MKNLNNFKIKNKKVLFRADLNVPYFNGLVTDKSRIFSIKKSIKKLLSQKNKIFIISHFGRPKDKYDKKFSLEFICPYLKEILEIKKIFFLNEFDSQSINKKINEMSFGDICLLENIRFIPEEEKNDVNFSKEITKFFDVFVNDAFSASHRLHSSIVGFTNFLPAVAGYSLIDEIKNIDSFLLNPKIPNIAIIGGSKISTKIAALNNLIELFGTIVIGGAMSNTFLVANGIKVGTSLVEKDLIDIANKFLKKAKDFNCNIILPIDVICSNNINDKNNIRYCDVNKISSNQMILDLGKKTSKIICNEITKNKMLLWNGPLGAFEFKPFDQSTLDVASAIKTHSKNKEIQAIAGGGDTISSIKLAKAEKGFKYISNAGGAFLEWLEGNESPGVIAIKENNLDYSSI